MRWLTALFFLLTLAAWLPAQPPDVPPPPPMPGGIDRFTGPFPRSAAVEFKDLIPSLIDALKDNDPDVRQHSAMALASIGPEAIKPLSEALKDPNKEKRSAASYALGQMGFTGREAVPVLLKALKDEEAIVRRSASQAISRILTADGMTFGHGMPGGQPNFGGGVGIVLPPIRSAPLAPVPPPDAPPGKPK